MIGSHFLTLRVITLSAMKNEVGVFGLVRMLRLQKVNDFRFENQISKRVVREFSYKIEII